MTNADKFKAALQQIERSKNPMPLVDLFHDDATVDTPAHAHKLTGHTAIEAYWREYLHAFGTVQSTFTVNQTIGDTSVLQWVSDGTLPNGRPIHYRGVSIVTFKGYKVSTFTAYYDSAAFVTPAAEVIASGAANAEGGD